MFTAATESSNILNELRNNVVDESKWLELARAQINPASQVEILLRAVATIPSSLNLWTQLIHTKTAHNDHNGLQEILRDALSLFPGETALWKTLLTLFPSTETATTALRYIDNSIVWPAYLQFLLSSKSLSFYERFEGCKRYLESEPAKMETLLGLLVDCGHIDVASSVLELTCPKNWETWNQVVLSDEATESLLAAALQQFPSQDALIVPKLVRRRLPGDFSAARTTILHHLESPSSVAAFCTLFTAAVQLYEHEIEANLRTHGQGGWSTARVLTEYANLIRKRPLLLSDAAIAESPNNVGIWLQRAELWRHRPHIAADVMETALRTVDPLRCENGEVVDLHIRYAMLLVANGSDVAQAAEHLETALNKSLNTSDAKARIYMALADIYQGAGKSTERALQVLESGIEAVPRHKKLWTHYMSVHVEGRTANMIEAFSRCCLQRMATMRIVVMVAKAFPQGSSNQVAVFDKGISMFPPPMTLPLWLQYIEVCQNESVAQQRELYAKALDALGDHKRAYEHLVYEYFKFEQRHGMYGSMIAARKRLHHILSRSTTLAIWDAYVTTFGSDTDGKRQGFERAIASLNDGEATTMALKMAEFEQGLGETERAQALQRYAADLQGSATWQPIDFVQAVST